MSDDKTEEPAGGDEPKAPANKKAKGPVKIRAKCHVRVEGKRLKPNESAAVSAEVASHLIGLGKAEKA